MGDNNLITLSLAFILLNLLDYLLTIVGLSMGFQEANLIVNFVGWDEAVIVKTFSAFGVPLGAIWLNRRSQPWGIRVLSFAVLFMILGAIWNVGVIMTK